MPRETKGELEHDGISSAIHLGQGKAKKPHGDELARIRAAGPSLESRETAIEDVKALSDEEAEPPQLAGEER
jgi:hypothetical protein